MATNPPQVFTSTEQDAVRKFNAGNERTKHRYLGFLTDAKRLSSATADQVAAALADFEATTGFKDFAQFRSEQAQSYKRKLDKATNPKTGRPLAKATISSRLAALKAFFQWLALQPGFKSRVNYSDAEYFNPSANDERIAKANREQPVPSIEQIRHVLDAMPGISDIERRDRALVAFTLLSGARDNAIASMSLKHVDLERRRIRQDPREGVSTKNAKTITSTFFPVGKDIEAIVRDWIQHLESGLLWGPDDPLFPTARVDVGPSGHFENVGLHRKHWKNAAAIRKIFKEAFGRAHLPYFQPHSFRKTLATLGERICPTPEAFKAWSQNLGHEHVLTTFTSYGCVSQQRQDQILAELAGAEPMQPTPIARPVVIVEAEQLDRIETLLRQQAAARHPD
jgi:integrase/recombinase XerC